MQDFNKTLLHSIGVKKDEISNRLAELRYIPVVGMINSELATDVNPLPDQPRFQIGRTDYPAY